MKGLNEMIKLERPSGKHKREALSFRQEFYDSGEDTINGSELLDRTDSYDEWLAAVTDNASASTVSPDWVVTDTYFAVDESGRIVGIIDLRHELRGFLTDFGHTGFSVRPSERRKGHASEMLALILKRAKEAGFRRLQLSAERKNEASVRTIQANGGKYERSFSYDGEEADVYFIELT